HGEPVEGYVLLSHEKAAHVRVWEELDRAHTQQLAIAGRVIERVKGGLSVDVGVPAFMPGSQADARPVRNLDQFLGQDVPVKVIVLKFEPGKDRISLGMKQLLPDPWQAIEERYAPQSRVVGRVVNVADYGAFVELEPGVEGLIHVSEMTWSRRMKHPSKLVKPGDQVEAVVLDLHPRERRISLGLKQLEANPWTTIEERYSIGSVVEGRVRSMTDFGAFIEIEEGIDGLVHV